MRGFLKEIKNVAVNRATNKIQGALGQLSSLGSGLPKNAGGVLGAPQAKLSRSQFDGTHVVYPEDLGSTGQGHYIQFFINEQEHANVKFGGKVGKLQKVGTRVVKEAIYDEDGEELVAEVREDIMAKAPVLNDFADKQPGNSGSTVSVKRAPTKRLASSICLYMPATVGVNQSADYSEPDIGGLAKMLAAFSDEFAKSGSFADSFGAIKGDIATSVGEKAKGALDLLMPGAKALAEITHGRVFSNRMEMVFKGVPRRTFSFQFTMMPKSEAEAKSIREICQMFRFYMAPSFEGEVNTSRTFIVPATFDIEYRLIGGGENNFLNKISTSVLTSCEITYGGERTTFFRPTDGGAPPVQTNITLNFKELEIITRERIGAGY